MQDQRKTKAQLIAELDDLRGQVSGTDGSSAERQLAVERVRAAAMTMEAPGDLRLVVAVLFREMRRLRMETPAASITFIDEAANTGTHYAACVDPARLGFCRNDPADRFVVVDDVVATLMSSDPLQALHQESILAPWRAGRQHTHSHAVAATGPEFDFYVSGFGMSATDAQELVGQIWRGDWVVTNVPFRFGVIGYREREHLPDHDNIVAELARGLELGFLRFLDFQRIEGQNRELTIQNSLERVRARVLSMQASEDLSGVVWDLLDESKVIGYPVCTVQIGVEQTDGIAEVWTATESGVRQDRGHPARIHGAPAQAEEVRAARHRGDSWHVGVLPEKHHQQPEEALYSHRVFFKEGIVACHAPRHMGDDELAILKRFTDVFGFAYARFLELQQKEQQNRELTIQNALERVRSRALAMQVSDEISDVTSVLFERFRSLGYDLYGIAIAVKDEASGFAFWVEKRTGQNVHRPFTRATSPATRSGANQGPNETGQARAAGAPWVVFEREGEALERLVRDLRKFTDTGSITLSLCSVEGATELSIADTGVGIPPEDLPHIFDEFRQVERQGGEQTEGTGFGLAIARKTVELLGGTISATSEVGVGTTFTVRMGDYDG